MNQTFAFPKFTQSFFNVPSSLLFTTNKDESELWQITYQYKLRLMFFHNFMKNVMTKKLNQQEIDYYKILISNYNFHLVFMTTALGKDLKINPTAKFKVNISKKANKDPLFVSLLPFIETNPDFIWDNDFFNVELVRGLIAIKNLYDSLPDDVNLLNEGVDAYAGVVFSKYIIDALDENIVRDDGYYKIISLSTILDEQFVGKYWLEAHLSYIYKIYNTSRLTFTNVLPFSAVYSVKENFYVEMINLMDKQLNDRGDRGVNLTCYNIIKKLGKRQTFADGGVLEDGGQIPSTDPYVWDTEFNIGDVIKIRIDRSADYDSPKNKFKIESIEVSPFARRSENPSGKFYVLSDDGGTFEGKDLELLEEVEIVETQTPITPTKVSEYDSDYKGELFSVYKCSNILYHSLANKRQDLLTIEKKSIIDLSLKEKFLISDNIVDWYLNAVELTYSNLLKDSYTNLIKIFNLQRESFSNFLTSITDTLYKKS